MVMISVVAALALVAAAPAKPLPLLDFAGITAATLGENGPVLECPSLGEDDCKLRRADFGGVKIVLSHVMLNTKTRRVDAIMIWFDPASNDTALAALKAKYGTPSDEKKKSTLTKQGKPVNLHGVRWWDFENDASVDYMSDGGDTSLTIWFPENRAAPEAPKVDF